MKDEEVALIDENNSQYIILILKQLLFLFMTATPIRSATHAYQLFSKMRIFKPRLATILFYFMRDQAATPQVVLQDLDFISEAQFYRIVRELKTAGMIVPHQRVRSSKKGGRRSLVYAIEGATQEDVINAIRKEEERSNPLLQTSRRIYQIVMDDFITPRGLKDFHYNQVLAVAKQLKMSGFYRVDVTKQVCKLLQHQGIKVTYPARGDF
jgi:hypothetical protein